MQFNVAAIALVTLIYSTVNAAAPQSSLSVDAIASGPATYYESGTVTVPEVLLLGVYQSGNHSFGDHPTGTAHVHVSGSALAPVDVVVSSYEPVQWIFDGPGAPYISKVVVNAYYPSTVVGIDSSKLIDRSGALNLGAYAYAWPSATGGSNTPLLVQNLQTLLGAPLSAFAGAYDATAFTVHLASVPEPVTLVLLTCGSITILGTRRRPTSHNRA